MELKITTTATLLFMQYGFKTITMDDIAKELKISKKTLYNFYKNKEDLINNCLENVTQSVDQKLLEVKGKKLNAIEQQFSIIDFLTESFSSKTQENCIYQLQKFYPSVYESMIQRKQERINFFQKENLNLGIEQKLYRNDLKTELLAHFFYIGKMGCKQIPLKGFSIVEMEYGFLEFYLNSIVTPKGKEILENLLDKK